MFKFETKPMGFQIEAENGAISVRSVRSMGLASMMGIQKNWGIVAVNGFRDWSSMLGILESSLGPFTITFLVRTPIEQTEMSAKELFKLELAKQQKNEGGDNGGDEGEDRVAVPVGGWRWRRQSAPIPTKAWVGAHCAQVSGEPSRASERVA